MQLTVVSTQPDPETAGAKFWVENLIQHLKQPDDPEAYAVLKRQHHLDCGAERPKPKLVASSRQRDASR